MTEAESPKGKDAQDTRVFDAAVDRFALHSGDALDQLTLRLSALSETARRARGKAIAVAIVGWGVLLFITLLSGTAAGFRGAFLADANAWARYLVASPLLLLMDRRVDVQLRRYLAHFAEAPLIAPHHMTQAADAVVRAIDRARSRHALLACAGLAFVLVLCGHLFRDVQLPDWRYAGTPENTRVTVAGLWAGLVTAPIFWFLLLRALWRYFCWAQLLRGIARLDLRLVATHPDRSGGLGFLGQHPNVFSAMMFALSISVAGSVAQGLSSGRISPDAYGWMLSIWVATTAALFLVSLTAFRAPLLDLKRRTRMAAAANATRRFRAQERETFGRNFAAPQDAEAEGDAADAAKIDEAAKKMRTIPFSRAAILPLLGAALLPLLAAGATQLPLGDIVSAAKKLLVL
ncbi:hypothetical protein R5H30_04495 [Sulfitobacter sp. D35]|uniref:hypothetical protein n=1 Tax=Sulfitobacter sp. D35 TaxID=3083252 RepID=UPI00296F5B8A|nr:hypothetical protein [Sulfitobacter sp. D35]MDW4497231.1 hypothetical protein [Sulfitobacter sp. D35]